MSEDMKKTILIVSTTETFTVRGLEMKLEGIGITPFFCAPRLDEVKKNCDLTDLFILYTDDGVNRTADTLVFIKDHCVANDKQIVVIGSKIECDAVKKHIPEGLIFKFYERPLNMETFLNEMDTYFTQESHQERRKTILIVDDDVSYMTMIMEWLKDTYRVSLASSGMQAITWLAKNKPDLILLDYEMPITSGPQVLEMIRSDATMADIPVMFLTGNGDKDCIMKVVALKPVGYQLKSIEKKQLRENIAIFFASVKKKPV